ncbi:MAG: helix-turn-helix transcriptional regulator [Clostridiales bacterium]|nr:helix-turn-helix transcriptional regulator [Clostridiales bacterium]
MFSKKLSTAILSICDSQQLSYEAAAELCDLSPRYFGSIARGQASPSVNTLEKLCNGFDRSPNELLGFSTAEEEMAFRMASQVNHYRECYLFNGHTTTYPLCPHCNGSIEREYQNYCSTCGQKLCWDFYQYATPVNNSHCL